MKQLKSIFAFALMAALLLSLVACGGGNAGKETVAKTQSPATTAPAATEQAAPTEGEAPGATSDLAKTYDYGEKGEFFLNYPESYSFERKFGVDTLKSADESIKIKFVADHGMDDYAATMEGYDLYVKESAGVKEEGLSYGGFEATRVTYEDSFGEVVMCTYILFGEGAGGYVGVNIEVNAASKDVLSANSAEIEAILSSVHLK